MISDLKTAFTVASFLNHKVSGVLQHFQPTAVTVRMHHCIASSRERCCVLSGGHGLPVAEVLCSGSPVAHINSEERGVDSDRLFSALKFEATDFREKIETGKKSIDSYLTFCRLHVPDPKRD
ncbi:hypothetical protein PFLUV_G00191630 [Perca fluviatilis]|uniref:Uncharacterized protein n=1 Tax=Perca fluviatilis TaxID=8168 RepID=A0A6A5DVR2_PERFL|nr:hypothetical protein PFLUV_G00191630 [Perca fluviatilis]